MWPFKTRRGITRIPSIRCNGLEVHWNVAAGWWEFRYDGTYYSMAENSTFDTSLPSKLDLVQPWLSSLELEIDNEIRTHLEGSNSGIAEKQIVGIDVSWLVDKGEIDVAFASDLWDGLGVNIVITDGRVTDSYAGD